MAGIITRLEDDGLIQSEISSSGGRPGPLAQRYSLAPGHVFVGAVHATGGLVEASVVDIAESGHETVSIPTDPDAPPAAQVLGTLKRAAAAAGITLDGVSSVVVGIHGVVDRASGDLGFAWDLPHWQGRVIGDLRPAIRGDLSLVNEVQLSGVAESVWGAARDRDDFAFLHIGLGLGLAYMHGRTPFGGSSGAAGQIGYLPVPGAPMPEITARGGEFGGDFQALAGRRALLDLARLAGHDGNDLHAIIQHAIAVSDAEFLDQVALRVATGLAGVVALMDPGLVVLGGETGRSGGAELARRVESALNRLSPFPTRVETTRLTEQQDPVVLGALHLAKARARELAWGAVPSSSSSVSASSQ